MAETGWKVRAAAEGLQAAAGRLGLAGPHCRIFLEELFRVLTAEAKAAAGDGESAALPDTPLPPFGPPPD